ncbi:MAG TPA: hypothetical protein VER08_03535 [Pyrinomonadaceae bacterium]|nr:hypothetical protein [Pyrinomonadaceae bacterium]
MSVGDLSSSAAKEFQAGPRCPACGARARRGRARFCATCGRGLDADGYVPSDAVRASYHFGQAAAPAERRAAAAKRRGGGDAYLSLGNEESGALKTARACVTYALVPYLGILFCPGALVFGGLGYVRARRAAHAGTRRAAATSVAFGLLVLAAQLFLWWLLYKVPEWSGR